MTLKKLKTPMTVYQADGTTQQVPYDPQVLAFVHLDMEIRNPLMSECGRLDVDPEYFGFEVYSTGGGCQALIKTLPNGDYLLLTDEDGFTIPATGDTTALLGRYNCKGKPIAVITLGDVPFDSDEE